MAQIATKESWAPPFLIHDDAELVDHPLVAADYLNLRRTAARLDHSYFWLSRNYKRLGLRPSRVGGKLLFERKEIDQLLKRLKIGVSGRPRARRF
jgi:hypothetical protein